MLTDKFIDRCAAAGACAEGLAWARERPRTALELATEHPAWAQWVVRTVGRRPPRSWTESSDPRVRIAARCRDLSWANLRGADLRGADLRGADLRGVDLRGADLCGANLSKANLREANLSKANLREADLRRADLRRADLSGADLRGADLRGADLRGADLRGADLCGAVLIETDLHDIVFAAHCRTTGENHEIP
jgi:hypothetical protein